MNLSYDEIGGLWEEGARRLREAGPADRLAMERVIDALVLDLRRRLGGAFTADELARLYVEEGTEWCFDIAVRAAPQNPAAWDMATVAGAAYARYVRMASDFGGGRRRTAEEERPASNDRRNG